MQTVNDNRVANYTLPEVADLLRVSTRTVQRMVGDGRLPAVRIGQRITRVTHQALAEFLDTNGGNQ